MNREKIKELADQAKLSWCIQTDFDKENMEKFAELIVQECAIALHPQLRDMISRGKAVDLINEHFGVK
jgi:hypothetical protein